MKQSQSVSRAIIESLERRQLLSVAPLGESHGSTGAANGGEVVVNGAAVGSFDVGEDIGSPAIAGTSAFAGGTFTITAGGSDITGSGDQFHFVHSPLSGDGVFSARVASLANTNSGAKAGLMMRSSTAADAAFAGIFITPSSGVIFLTRATDGATASSSAIGAVTAPRWVRLVKSSSNITGYFSNDGSTWNQVGTQQSIALGASPRLGLAVTSRNIAAATTATLSGVSYLLPEGFINADIGAPASLGSAVFDPAARTYSVSGAGTGMQAAADQLNFTYRTMTGGGEISALLNAAPTPSGKAALMIRSGTTAGAQFASIGLTSSGISFDWRTTANGTASSATTTAPAGPVWLRLSQQGNAFLAHYSSDGSTWTQVGSSQAITMPNATALAGMAVASGSTSVVASAGFESLRVLQAGWKVADIGAPAAIGSATFDPPSNTYTFAGAGTGLSPSGDVISFLSRSMTGDGNTVAYLNSFNATNPAARAGVMMRASSAAEAPFVGLFLTPQNGVLLAYRLAAGGAIVQQSSAAGVSGPLSLKLTRVGNNISGSYSIDGVTFTPVGTAVGVSFTSTVQAGTAVASGASDTLAVASFTGIAAGKSLPPGAGIYSATDELFLNDLSARSVNFFWTESNASTGMAPDGSSASGGSPSAASSIASTGFALTALTIGDQRGFINRADAYQRALNTVNFLNTTAAQVNGFFYHFINPVTGARLGNSELSPMDSALLMAGVLNAAQYWAGTPIETAAMAVFNRVNWPWMQKPSGQYYGQWTPESGFAYGYGDFSEAVLIYLLGLGSTTHPAAASSWNSWLRSPVINYNGFNFITAQTGALFTTQYPLAWYDLRGLSDSFGLNYHNNAATAALAQRQMAVNLSGTWPQFGLNNWGFTAADGQGGYTVWGGPPPTSNINGTVVPTGPGGSLAFIPRQGVDALQYMKATYGGTVYKKYGFVDAFNPHNGWTSSIVLGIDVGMMLAAAENSRSGFVWNVFNQTQVARQSAALAFPSLKPSLQSAVTRKNNPSLGNNDLAIPQGDELSIDPRTGGPTQLVLTFGANVVKGPSFAVTLSSGSVVSSSTSGTVLTINLTGVTDAQTLNVNVSDVRHTANSSGGTYTLRVGVLAGDANRSGAVDLDDFTILASSFGLSPGTFQQADFNIDGTVNLDDFTVLASQFGKTLPASIATRAQSPAVAPAVFNSTTIGDVRLSRWYDLDEELQGAGEPLIA